MALADGFEGDQRIMQARQSISCFSSTRPKTLVERVPAYIDADFPIKYEQVAQDPHREMCANLQYSAGKLPLAAAWPGEIRMQEGHYTYLWWVV